jgi:hypothetical protein
MLRLRRSSCKFPTISITCGRTRPTGRPRPKRVKKFSLGARFAIQTSQRFALSPRPRTRVASKRKPSYGDQLDKKPIRFDQRCSCFRTTVDQAQRPRLRRKACANAIRAPRHWPIDKGPTAPQRQRKPIGLKTKKAPANIKVLGIVERARIIASCQLQIAPITV